MIFSKKYTIISSKSIKGDGKKSTVTNNFINSVSENLPFKINTDTLNSPILICTDKFKILYKNKSSSFLGVKRVGSYITHHISDRDIELLKLNDFEINPCICVNLHTANKNEESVLAFVCKYSFDSNRTLWFFPKINEMFINSAAQNDDFKSDLLRFFPYVARFITAEKPTTDEASSIKLSVALSKACIYSAIDRFSVFSEFPTLSYNSLTSLVQRFISENFEPLGYNLHITSITPKEFFLVKDPHVLLSMYFNLLLSLLECSEIPAGEITVTIENCEAVIKTCIQLEFEPNLETDLNFLASVYQSRSLDFTVCCKLCNMLGLKIDISPCKKQLYNYEFSLRTPLSLPSRMHSPTEDNFDVMYNKLLYFLTYI